jgi:hypothetical protein
MQPTDMLLYVRQNLRAVGPRCWPAIACATGKPLSTLRKIAYGDRKNPKLDTIQPVANYFQDQERRA